jgi:UDPglucose 6-dehydrogenase
MRIGFNGVGKLGLPVAYAFASKGHEVYGYDIDDRIYEYIAEKTYPNQEEGLAPLMDKYKVFMVDDLKTLVREADIIFTAIQTPHSKEYEGSARVPEERRDFDYTYLKQGISDLAKECASQKKHLDIAIISTVLPGTINREIRPLLNKYTHLVYEPMFIAMGTVVADTLNPEFVLLGVDEPGVAGRLEQFYGTIHDKPCFKTDINTAEGIKVFYNTFITTKTVLGNLYGELAHKLGMNADDIYKALSMATDRIISPKYLKAGLADGGGCHPRDNIALSYIAEKTNLSFNYFDALMEAREKHMQWIADVVILQAHERNLPIFVLGESFKPGTLIKTGSAACLLANILSETHDIIVLPEFTEPRNKGVYVIGVAHEEYKSTKYPRGSVVIDAFRFIGKQEGVEIVGIGNGQTSPERTTA